MIDVKILGPMVLMSGGTLVGLGPQQQVLLLVLLLAGDRGVPASRLAELLWERGAGDRAAATLRSHVAHLRRALLAPAGWAGHSGLGSHDRGGIAGDQTPHDQPRLVTRRLADGTAYALHIHSEQVDSGRFARLVADGRSALHEGRLREANILLGAARTLWRGQPLPEVAHRPFAISEVRRLEALHRAAWSSWAEAQVRLGGHREVAGELEVMVARWPGDEGLRRLLVACLLQSGRVGDAARVCRDGIVQALSQGLDPAGMEQLQRELLGPAPRPALLWALPGQPGSQAS